MSVLYGIQIGYTNWKNPDELLIIGYHNIAPDKDKEAYFKHSMWTASLSSFKAQMKLLHDLGYHSVTLDDVYAWRMGKKKLDPKSFAITFDDGFLSSKKLVEPILKSYGFQGSVFVIGSLIDNHHGPYDPSKRQHTSRKDMEDQETLHFYAHTYGLHHKTSKGAMLDTVSKKTMIRDCEKEKKVVSMRYYAYPYGAYNDTIQDVLKQQGTLLAFSFNENRKVRKNDDPYALPRFCVNGYTTLDVFRAMLMSR